MLKLKTLYHMIFLYVLFFSLLINLICFRNVYFLEISMDRKKNRTKKKYSFTFHCKLRFELFVVMYFIFNKSNLELFTWCWNISMFQSFFNMAVNLIKSKFIVSLLLSFFQCFKDKASDIFFSSNHKGWIIWVASQLLIQLSTLLLSNYVIKVEFLVFYLILWLWTSTY